MKCKHLLVAIALVLTISISSRQIVRAGAPATTSPSAAAIRGVVKFEGTAPKAKPISMAADPSCARQHPGPVSTPEVVADSKGGLQNVLVFISDGLGDRTFDPPAQPVVITQKGCLYQPHVLAVQANQPIEVVNDDPTMHNIHPAPTNNREWNKAEQPGAKVEETFAREEIAIPVRCNVHPWMRGYIAVLKNPYFALTKPDGTFDLPNLPPGTYTVKAWHEKLGTSTQTITVEANQTKEINFVFKSM
ncbi:MAG: carboxypeptidase regulatory-like domain-containing protein [Terriglobales bacterium]